jgi:CRP-like cAMP-binding protein
MLDHAANYPVRSLAAGEVLVAEGRRTGALYVTRSGHFDVTRLGSKIARIAEPGSVIGEVSALLGADDHGATVTAVTEAEVHVIAVPDEFLALDGVSLEVARMLAGRLNRLVTYLADVQAQYANAGGHLEMLDEILSELSFGAPPTADPGSEREPDPFY